MNGTSTPNSTIHPDREVATYSTRFGGVSFRPSDHFQSCDEIERLAIARLVQPATDFL